MNTIAMLLAEIRYRKTNFALSLTAVVFAVTLLVAGPILVDGYGRQTDTELADLQRGVEEAAQRVAQSEAASAAKLAQLEDDTRKTMITMGFNLMILHGSTDMSSFWTTGYPTVDMPEEYVERLLKDPRLTMVTHVVGTLREKITWRGRPVSLAGYMADATATHSRKKVPMGFHVEPGTAFLGHHLAGDIKVGDTIEVLDTPLRVAQVLPERGDEMDNTIVTNLVDAQKMLGKPGKVNEILALDCRCAEADLPRIRKQVADILPDCLVNRVSTRAVARARQRALVAEMYEQTIGRQKADLEARKRHLAETAASRARIQNAMIALADVVTPLVVLAAAIWVGLLATANVRQRMTEIGLLRALGKGSGMIASLLLGKAVLLGIVGGAVGLALGGGLAWYLSDRVLDLPPDQFRVPISMAVTALVGAPLLSALASYLPTLSALTQDPAVVLREQ